MTTAEWLEAKNFMAKLGVACPSSSDLMYGGIVGSVLVVDIVTPHPSPWFRGPHALVLADPRPEPFYRVRGELGLFPVQP